MSNTLFAWQNYVTQNGTILLANSEEASLPAANLANDQGAPSMAWQTVAGVVTSAGGAQFTVTPPSTGQTWRALGLFRTNLTASAVVNFALKNGSTTVFSGSATPMPPYGQVVVVLPRDTTANFLQVTINDASNPDGFINVPLCYAGPAFVPATGASWQSTFGRNDSSTATRARGGPQFINLQWQCRTATINLQGIRASEVWPGVDALRFNARLGGNVLYVPDTSSSFIQQETIYGLLKDAAPISFPYQAADRRAWSATIEERL